MCTGEYMHRSQYKIEYYSPHDHYLYAEYRVRMQWNSFKQLLQRKNRLLCTNKGHYIYIYMHIQTYIHTHTYIAKIVSSEVNHNSNYTIKIIMQINMHWYTWKACYCIVIASFGSKIINLVVKKGTSIVSVYLVILL